MAENTSDSKLFTEFPPISTSEWEEVINKDLKGADYDKKLVWKTMEGFSVKPYYRAEDLENIKNSHASPGDFPYLRGTKLSTNNWLVRQDFDACKPEEANAKAVDVIKKGVDSVGFITCTDCEPSVESISKLIAGIDATNSEINFVSSCSSRKILPFLIEYLKGQKIDLSKVKGSFDYSPLSAFSLKGKFCVDAKTAAARTLEVIEKGRELPEFRLISVRGDIFRNAGSSIVQELAFSLAMGVEYMNWLTEQGVNSSEVLSKMKFTFAVGSSYFMEIAKFRAARYLWAKIAEAYTPQDIENAKMCIHGVNSEWNKTVYDPYVNMLRTTTEAMSGVLGGIHSFTVLPFDAPFQDPTVFSERVARNQQLVLKEEAYFGKVVDPAAGSYYIEKLTQSIIDNAWELFIKVQEMGGYTEAFSKGFIQSDIKAVATKREANIATRRQTVLGTNQYPNFDEVTDTKAVKIDMVKKPEVQKSAETICEPLIQYRGSQALEELRYRTDATGKRPKTFMLTLGNLAFRRARAQFSCNFFACAGFEVIDNIGFKTIDEGLKAAMDAKADIVVICSSDEDYETLAIEAFEKLNGKAIFVVAGEPACKPTLEAKGITNFISVKSNVLETLNEYQKKLNIN
jgi:methylmalonyl-CoA mutase